MFTGGLIRNQGFVGGAGVRPSIVGTQFFSPVLRWHLGVMFNEVKKDSFGAYEFREGFMYQWVAVGK